MKIKSFKTSIILYFAAILIVSLTLLGTISYQTFSTFTRKEMIKSTTSITSQVNQSLDIYLNEIKDSLHFLAIDQSLIAILQNSIFEDNLYVSDQNRTRISILLNNIFSEKSDIRGYFIYNYDHRKQFINSARSIDFASPFLRQVWLDFKDTEYALQFKFYGAHKPDYYDNYEAAPDQQDNIITIAANIKDAYDPSNPNLYGVAVFDYNVNKLKRIFTSTETELGIRSLVIDDKRQVIYQTDPALTLSLDDMDHLFTAEAGHWQQNVNGNNWLVAFSTSHVTGWKTVSLLPLAQLNKNLSVIRNTTLVLLASMIVITLLLASALTIRTTRPILKLVKFMKEVGKGKLDIRMERQTEYEEIMILNRGINDMLDRMKDLIADSVNRSLLQKEAEYKTLQTKMNPHFLYNTLQSISSLSILGRNQDVEWVTHALREMLHYSLYDIHDRVPLAEELRVVQHYLQIQNIRYDGRLTYTVQAVESALACPVNKIMLQPLIENAIYHGLESMEGPWRISIRIEDHGDHVRVEVADNGVGMTAERLRTLREELAAKEARSGRIGLASIADRLALKFSALAKLQINSEWGQGTTVTLTIPKPEELRGETDADHASDRR